MEATSETAGGAGVPAELIIQNGRLKGTCKPLSQAVTLMGRGNGCDIRLNVDGVSAVHCVLAHGADGLTIRDLQTSAGTVVNGRPVGMAALHDGDHITVGPFQFQVRIKAPIGPSPAELIARHSQEKDALRIQAAAVAAQQTALAEEEARIQQRKSGLEQQEVQLGAHLEEKRRKLQELRDKTREAHTALQVAQSLHQEQVSESQRDLSQAREEIEDARREAQTERHRLLTLLKRLRQRWHRHWAGERSTIQHREQEVARHWRAIDQERQLLQDEKHDLNQAILRFNGETELGRRQLQADWDEFRSEKRQEEETRAREQARMFERAAALDQQEADLTDLERDLTDQRRRCQEMRLRLEKETEGLETRVGNQRRKIVDHEQELARLDTALKEKKALAAGLETTLEGQEAVPDVTAEPVAKKAPAVEVSSSESSVEIAALKKSCEDRLRSLEKLSSELADQRLHVAEQCERLVQSQHRWQQSRDAVVVDLEEQASTLKQREHSCCQREQALELADYRLRQQQASSAQIQKHLEGWQARMSARQAIWEGERERLLTDIQCREKTAEQRLASVNQLHQRWTKRRRREIEWLQAERASSDKLRQQCTTLQEACQRRSTALEQAQRDLAERSLALEQLQQEALNQSANPAGGTRRLERLKARWTALSEAAREGISQERESLKTEAERLEEYHRKLQKHAGKLAAQQAELARNQSEWEQQQLLAQEEMTRLRSEVLHSHGQRELYEKQLVDVREETERLARLLLDEAEPMAIPIFKAA